MDKVRLKIFSQEEILQSKLAAILVGDYCSETHVKTIVDEEVSLYTFHKWGFGPRVEGRMVRLVFTDRWVEGGESQFIWTPQEILVTTCWTDGGYVCESPSSTGVKMAWDEFLSFVRACETESKAIKWDEMFKDHGAGI